VPSKLPRIAVTADAEPSSALQRVRAATGSTEADATLVRRLAVEGAEAELAAGRAAITAVDRAFESLHEVRVDWTIQQRR
jgi:hypothetical protein